MRKIYFSTSLGNKVITRRSTNTTDSSSHSIIDAGTQFTKKLDALNHFTLRESRKLPYPWTDTARLDLKKPFLKYKERELVILRSGVYGYVAYE